MHNQTLPCKFQLNPSSRLGGVVRTRFFDFDDLRTYLRTDGKSFCQVHNQTPKGKFPEDFSSIYPAIQEELWSKDFFILMTYGLTYRLTSKLFVRCTTRHLQENSLKILDQTIRGVLVTRCFYSRLQTGGRTDGQTGGI